ncbi:MAG: hypothetical protein IJL78_01485, partial [Lachnospiraceae bacterium]|nr:hypothetical protein [Lachnospiraceae bacterium]
MNKIRRILSILLVFVMVFSLSASHVYAEEDTSIEGEVVSQEENNETNEEEVNEDAISQEEINEKTEIVNENIETVTEETDIVFDETETVEVFNEGTAAAEVDGNAYTTVAAAIAAATAGQTVKLLADHVGVITINKSITFDMNGHDINTENAATAAIEVNGNVNVT